jgi:uncharacterized protein
MARPIKPRRIILPHKGITFIPEDKEKFNGEETHLLSEEFEVIKLIDYENLNQSKAAKVMGLSRPTITRIYERARKKIAEVLIESKRLKIEGGNVYFGKNWYNCTDCDSFFNVPNEIIFEKICPVCSGSSLQELNLNN